MLERVCITSDTTIDPHSPLDIGEIAESMLYYGEVRVIANVAGLNQLIRVIPFDDLKRALSDGRLQVTFVDSMLAILTVDRGTETERHAPVMTTVAPKQFPEHLDNAFELAGLSRGEAQKRRKSISRFFDKEEIDPSVIVAVKSDLESPNYLEKAIPELVRSMSGDRDPQTGVRFSIDKVGDFYRVSSNVDLSRLHLFTDTPLSESDSLDEAHILSKLTRPREALSWSSTYASDLYTDSQSEVLLSLLLEPAFEESALHGQQLALFTKEILGGKSVRDAVNSGQRTFGDVLDLLDRAGRFKDWILQQPFDSDLLNEYVNEVGQFEQLDSVPSKVLRWAFCTSIGIATIPAHVIIGASLALFDQLLTKRIFGGWLPNQFVERRLSVFTSEERD
jgi:hypothetical protein